MASVTSYRKTANICKFYHPRHPKHKPNIHATQYIISQDPQKPVLRIGILLPVLNPVNIRRVFSCGLMGYPKPLKGHRLPWELKEAEEWYSITLWNETNHGNCTYYWLGNEDACLRAKAITISNKLFFCLRCVHCWGGWSVTSFSLSYCSALKFMTMTKVKYFILNLTL